METKQEIFTLPSKVHSPVCIAGMHRSGTSTVAQLLYRCGLYLGEEGDLFGASPDNADGYWEHKKFVDMNQRIFEAHGAGWDAPPPRIEAPEENERLPPLEAEARELLQNFEGHGPWGWKDPRNSLTLPFWTRLVPDAKVVVCVRNPLEVAFSLRKRSMASLAFGFGLWLEYNRRILDDTPPERLVITHYESYFYRPQAEIRRLLDFLGLHASDQLIAQSRTSTVKERLRSHAITNEEVEETARRTLKPEAAEELLDMYGTLRRKAEWDDDFTSSAKLSNLHG